MGTIEGIHVTLLCSKEIQTALKKNLKFYGQKKKRKRNVFVIHVYIYIIAIEKKGFSFFIELSLSVWGGLCNVTMVYKVSIVRRKQHNVS